MDFGNEVFVARVNPAYDGIVMSDEQYGKGPSPITLNYELLIFNSDKYIL
jgi:hypothetical protein